MIIQLGNGWVLDTEPTDTLPYKVNERCKHHKKTFDIDGTTIDICDLTKFNKNNYYYCHNCNYFEKVK